MTNEHEPGDVVKPSGANDGRASTSKEQGFSDEGQASSGKGRKDARSRKERLTGSTHFGDVDFHEETPADIGDATWGEVFRACCVHDPKDWAFISVGLTALLFFLYFFLLGLELLGTSAKVIGGCTAGTLLSTEMNPIAALMIGVLATVLLQSSSTTTSIVVGLVGGGAVPVEQSIYIIMGANIGTSITNTIVALGHLGNGDELERAFAGATVHDCFNYLSVIVFLPVEAATGFLFYLTRAMLPGEAFEKGDSWEGPIKKLVSPLGDLIIAENKKVIEAVAKGGSCSDYYPVRCKDGIEDYDHCRPCKKDEDVEECDPAKQGWGLISCNDETNKCPAFFQDGANKDDDKVSGGVCLFLSLVMLIVCLIGLVSLLQRMLLGTSTRVIYKATNINGYLAMALGCGITILVQSSSITTSALTPLVGMGVIQIEQMYPLTLGANIGTTFTAIMAAMVSDKIESMQTALAHLSFNIVGIIIWYPVPFMRRIPISIAMKLGKATRAWRGFPLLYIFVMFFAVPALLLGISACFQKDTRGFTALGAFLCVAFGLAFLYYMYWWRYKDGKEKCTTYLKTTQRRKDAVRRLPDHIDFVMSELERLREHTGLADNEGGDVEEGGTGKKLESSDDEE